MKKEEKKEYYHIGEVAKMLNITPRTIRYYEELKLMDEPLRINNSIRLYSKEDIRRLKFILKLKELGLTLKEMKELADIYNEHKKEKSILPRLVELLDAHIDKIDKKMAKLASLRSDIVEYRKRIVDAMNEEDNDEANKSAG
ncbi:MerR family transcriptional regulator [Hippea jasoniae]|uniref:MerR family transcriptional regulator n=1 Tax=Hippea jasoniae TaxID=944479 RepID=UPI0005501328|nr:MerR family transcriptional regulator [Hippea jasoniae]